MSDRVELDLAAVALPRGFCRLDTALEAVVRCAPAAMRFAGGASITVGSTGQFHTLVSSDDTVRQMDEHQYETGAGPCLSAATSGQPVHSRSIAEEDRWPAFVATAIEQGIASILSWPLTTSDGSFGALNIYSRTVGGFGPDHRTCAAHLARQAGLLLTEATATDAASAAMDRRIAAALQAREVIAHAEGILMARRRLDADAASSFLVRAARTAEVTVLEISHTLVDSAGPDWPGPVYG